MPTKVAYCVVTFLGFPHCAETVNSVPDSERLMLIDNSINDWPLSRCWNYAIDRLCVTEGYRAVVICNDDIVLQPETGKWLFEALLFKQFTEERQHKDRELLLVSAYNTRDHEDVGPRWGTGPDFSCFIVSPKIHQVMGRFDENFYPAYFEDNDAHWRLQASGFEAMSYAPYFHSGSGTLHHVDAARRAVIEQGYDKNKAYYARKWGGLPGHEQFRAAFNGQPVAA